MNRSQRKNSDRNNDATFTELTIASTLQAAKQPEQVIIERLRACGFGKEATFAVKLALEEALTNAVKHGNRNDPEKRVTVRFSIDEGKSVIFVRDEGPGFEPQRVPDPTEPGRLSIPSGRGIMLIRAYMDEVRFGMNGREVCLIKHNR